MLLLVGQILAVDADDLAALVAVVGEHILVALDAVRVVIARCKTKYLLSSIFQININFIISDKIIEHKMCTGGRSGGPPGCRRSGGRTWCTPPLLTRVCCPMQL